MRTGSSQAMSTFPHPFITKSMARFAALPGARSVAGLKSEDAAIVLELVLTDALDALEAALGAAISMGPRAPAKSRARSGSCGRSCSDSSRCTWSLTFISPASSDMRRRVFTTSAAILGCTPPI